MKPKVVLYNPEAVFYTMPLALLAVGSALDPAVYDVHIFDARLNGTTPDAVLAACDGALCFGVTALTGAPLKDALRMTRAVKARYPDLPTVWGGWHPSLFPTATLDEAGIDVSVQGQGEGTFVELVEALRQDHPLGALPGLTYRQEGRTCQNPPRLLEDMDLLPAHRYDLLDVEAYFKLKGQRQLDYISSTGCHFRCAFCADPFVFKRSWVAIGPERMGKELDALWHRYRFTELAFQDETFFTYKKRIAAIAEQILSRNLAFDWTATMRADQGMRLTEESRTPARGSHTTCSNKGTNYPPRLRIGPRLILSAPPAPGFPKKNTG